MTVDWRITADFGSGAQDITEHCSALSRQRQAHNELNPTINAAMFTVTDLATANKFLAASDDVPVVITKDGAAWFTGQVDPGYELVMASTIDDMRITVVGNMINLKETINESFSWSNYKVCDTSSTSTSILHQLLVKAGFSIGDLSLTTVNKTLTRYAVDKAEEKSFWDEIKTLGYEFGFVLDEDFDGTLVMHMLHPTSISPTYITDAATAHGRGTTRRRRRYEAARVTWFPVTKDYNVSVFKDTTGGDEQSKMRVEMDNGDYYPEGSDAAGVYAVYQYPDAEILGVDNPQLDFSYAGTVSVASQAYENRRAAISFACSADGSALTFFEIRGDVIYHDRTKTHKEVVYAVAGSQRILDYKAQFIEAEADAQQLASDLSQYYDNARLTYSFELLDADMAAEVNQVLTLDSEAQSVEKTMRIVEIREDEWGQRVITAEGISAYSLQSSTTQNEIKPPASDVPPGAGSQRNNVNIVDLFISGFLKAGEGVLSQPGTIWRYSSTSFVGYVTALAYLDGAVIGGSTQNEIAKSTDGGATFGSLITNSHTNPIRVIDAGNGILIAVGDNGEISRSTDGGDTWSTLISNAFATAGTDIYGLAYDDENDIWVATGMGSPYVLTSDDGGQTWSTVTTAPSQTLRKVTFCGNSTFVAVAYADDDVWKSTDSGDTWTQITGVTSSAYHGIAVDYGGGALIASFFDSGAAVGSKWKLARSIDLGETWTVIGTDDYESYQIVYARGVFFMGTVKSLDNGLSLDTVTMPGPGLAACYDYTNDSFVVGASLTADDIYYSTWLLAGAGIVEQGSNSNGEYVIFSNGLQVCWGSTSGTVSALSAYGSIYYDASVFSGTFPKAFASTPKMVGELVSNGVGGLRGFAASSASAFSGGCWNGTNTTPTVSVNWIAIGWAA